MSGLLTGYAFTKQFPEIDTTSADSNGSSSLQGTVVAIYEIGCFFGAIIAFVFGERLGRRWTIIWGCIILTIGAAIQTSAYGIAQLIAGRIVAGLGNGMNTATIRKVIRQHICEPADMSLAVWHSELMKPADRGRGLSVELAITVFGVMLSYWTDYGMSYVKNEAQFRFPIAFQIVFAVVAAIAVFALPESPRWVSTVFPPRNKF